jgi:hypothetical protein
MEAMDIDPVDPAPSAVPIAEVVKEVQKMVQEAAAPEKRRKMETSSSTDPGVSLATALKTLIPPKRGRGRPKGSGTKAKGGARKKRGPNKSTLFWNSPHIFMNASGGIKKRLNPIARCKASLIINHASLKIRDSVPKGTQSPQFLFVQRPGWKAKWCVKNKWGRIVSVNRMIASKTRNTISSARGEKGRIRSDSYTKVKGVGSLGRALSQLDSKAVCLYSF